MTVRTSVRVDYKQLCAFVAQVFTAHDVPSDRAHIAAEALCYGDLAGLHSHGVVNLTRLYLPLFADARVDPRAELEVLTDRGAAVLLDAHRALGLWAASAAMDMAMDCAATYGIGLVSVRNGTHFGCAGHHAARALQREMVGIVASNCGRQRIARPPGGRLAMLGTNPFSIASPAGEHHPFVLDMSTTAVPTGRVRAAARAGQAVPPGWLEDEAGNPVTDPAAFDRGEAHLLWLGGSGTGQHKGFGLGLMVEVLAALVPGAGLGPNADALAADALDTDALDTDALAGNGGPAGRDDDIGFLIAAIAPGALRPSGELRRDAQALFGTLLACPPTREGAPVRYPGWYEAERAHAHHREGVPLAEPLYLELRDVADQLELRIPAPVGAS